MTTFKVYGQPYLVNGNLIKPYLKIQSLHLYSHYKPYCYAKVNVSTKPMPLSKYSAYDQTSAEEWLTRVRRTVLFADITGLTPTKANYSSLTSRANAAMRCDHVTRWVSPWGTQFILNEPYIAEPDFQLKLAEQGLAVVIVPTDLSPYCGLWRPNKGAKPGTTSYLICDIADAEELNHLFNNVNLSLIPAWNCVKGVVYA